MDKTPEWCERRQLRFTLVDLKKLDHKDDPWVLANRVAKVFYVLDPETEKHIVFLKNKKLLGLTM
jgi:hypothetical protein